MLASIGRRLSSALLAPRPAVARAPALLAQPLSWQRVVSPLLGALSGRARSIITVDVYQPAERSSSGDPSSRAQVQAEVARSEEIALSMYNRITQAEVHRGTLVNPRRGGKRFARYQQPALASRDSSAHPHNGSNRRCALCVRSLAYSHADIRRLVALLCSAGCKLEAAQEEDADVHELDHVSEAAQPGVIMRDGCANGSFAWWRGAGRGLPRARVATLHSIRASPRRLPRCAQVPPPPPPPPPHQPPQPAFCHSGAAHAVTAPPPAHWPRLRGIGACADKRVS